MILEAIELTKSYTIDGRQTVILSGVDLALAAGEFVAIQGASGSGKSTLLSLLSALDRPTSGRLLVEGRDVTTATEDDLAVLRNRSIGFVFQAFHLVPSLSAWENVAFPAELAGHREARSEARHLLERLGLGGRLNSLPHQLSGGEKQRVALGRALINHPRILFADEPTGNLDKRSGDEVLALLLDMRKAAGTALVLVTHSQTLAAAAERRLTLVDGTLR
ncbi:MAG TPA: ABC transporter ATP-binding protein [Candidatus Xenobia bacterium]